MFEGIRDQLTEILQGIVASAVASIPRLLAGLVLLALALVVASLVERIVRVVMGRLKFDSLVRRTGIDHWLHRMGIRHSLNDVLPRLLYFVLLFIFAREAADAMGLEAISGAIATLIGYLPKIIAAFLVLLFGSAIAQVAGRAVEEAGRGSGLDFAPVLGRFTTGVLLFVLIVMALGQLELDTVIVRQLSILLVAGVVAGLSLSFGLGSRDVTRNLLAGFYVRRLFKVGEEIEVNGHHGVLEAITPTQTILRDGPRTVVLANSAFLESPARK
jgi:small-conductance mechanosensitive channel